jgi:LmbE family N-acetylglucosaminyl deacetylase
MQGLKHRRRGVRREVKTERSERARTPGSLPEGPILGVWAHPDDETYLSAGIMGEAVRRGERVVCVTATRGEEGSWDEERWPTSEMGRIREAELMASLQVLGVNEHHWLDYYDGTCSKVPLEEGVKRVRSIMEDAAPRSVLTFGPDGMTGHADHKSVSAWTTEAFRRAAPQGARLYYATQTPEWAEEFVPELNRFNVFMEEGTPPVTSQEELAIDFELPSGVLELKLKAIEAHVSQVEGMLNAFGQDYFRRANRAEFFRLAAVQE